MSYLVLARKWRPRRFSELVGQEHVVRALTNALDSGRVHHAFLFTGTRGVGKTTIARIFAKSLNCERGTSAEPCGECNSCRDIDAGRFVDLLEIDAASNTGVDNVRDLIDNAQYMPSRGRVKVYLIDEVHMLSKPAFNALLKTLEEPPGHVKFLLATTDPQKLPVTVLSRCLQFNLKRLDEAQIGGQITRILEAEDIAAEPGAIRQLSRAADGSLRDGLSLLDQAIAYTGSSSGGAGLEEAAVTSMLGTVDRTQVGALLATLAAGDGEALLATVAALAEFSPDWSAVLDGLAEVLHRIQVRQLVPGAVTDDAAVDVEALAARLQPEVVQLWYQMALGGRRELPLAPSPRAGFEMSVLRMLAFRPESVESAAAPSAPPAAAPVARRSSADAAAAARAALAQPETAVAARAGRVAEPASPAAKPQAPVAPPPAEGAVSAPTLAAPTVAAKPSGASSQAPQAEPAARRLADADAWLDLVATVQMRGPTRELAAHAVFVGHDGRVLRLALPPADEHLRAPALVAQLADVLAPALGGAPTIRFETAPTAGETLHQRSQRELDTRQAAAEEAFVNDPEVQRLIDRHGAKLVPDSIRPLDEA